MKDLVQHGLAAANMVRNVLDVGGAAYAGGQVETGDLDADAMAALELVGGAMISIAYSLMSPGTTGFCAARVSGCQGRPGSERASSSARCDALSQPRVSSRSCKIAR